MYLTYSNLGYTQTYNVGVFELLCLLPLAIPAIVIVVGIAPLYRWISIHLTESPISLAGVYSMLILPYTYRSLSAALDAVDVENYLEDILNEELTCDCQE